MSNYEWTALWNLIPQVGATLLVILLLGMILLHRPARGQAQVRRLDRREFRRNERRTGHQLAIVNERRDRDRRN